MKISGKIIASALMVFFLTSWTATPDNDCQVLLETISGTYEGGCKRGKADGMGKAVGEDTYEGEFKKGLPDGQGKYTWANGDVFEGEWKDGVKEGEGKLVVKRESLQDSIVSGFWKDDKYVGKYEHPYDVASKSSNINKVRVVKQGLSPNQVDISVVRKNQSVRYSNLRITSNAGNYYSGKFQVSQFPLELEIEFDSASATGFGAAKEKSTCKVKIMEPGNWQITIDLSNV